MSNILFICGGRLVPASRFRVDPIARGLRQRGYSTRIIYGYGALDQWLGNGRARWSYRACARLIRAVRTWAAHNNGPVVIQRLAVPWNAWPEVSLSLRCPLIFDFDDAVFLNQGGQLSRSRERALRRVWEGSKHVVAGNSWLASFAQRYADVTVIPTCIDTSAYAPRPKRPEFEAKTLKIGWIGTSFNQQYLKQLVAALLQLKRENYRFEFVLCSDMSPLEELSDLHPTFIKWSAAEEMAVLQSFDIGVMPLEDDDWCRGKCSFKAIQYLAVGVPVIASSVGFNVDVIENGKQGYLVEKGQWYDAFKALIENPEMRARMGRAARLRACREFDIQNAVDEYERIVNAASC